MNYKAWATRIVDSLMKVMEDNVDYPDVVDELAKMLEADMKEICNDCEWYHNCDDCDERMPDEPRINEGYL